MYFDLHNPDRQLNTGIAQFGTMVAPAIAPVLGGILTHFLGWRWLFWFLTILAVVFLIPLALTFPETGRNVVGNGSIPPQGWNMSLLNYLQTRRIERSDTLNRTQSRQEKKAAQAELARNRKLRWPNPLKTVHIILEKDVGMLLLYNALVYTAFYDVTASLPSLFAEIYGFNELQIGYALLFPTTWRKMVTIFQLEFHPLWSRDFHSFHRFRSLHGCEL